MNFKKLFVGVTLAATLFTTSNAFAYTIKPGDTFWKISRANDIPLSQIV
jgi:LysM repeat protein